VILCSYDSPAKQFKEKFKRKNFKRGVPVGNLIRLASEAESRNVSIL
jgi:hypothetical protein